MTSQQSGPGTSFVTLEDRVLDAAHDCMLRWGQSKVTMDDIVAASRVSRATIYRLFPGGREVLFEALRLREVNAFLEALQEAADGAEGFEEVVATLVTTAMQAMRTDECLIAMMATDPSYMLDELTVAGLPCIIAAATTTLRRHLRPYVSAETADRLVDVLVRLTISYYLAPSDLVDLGELDQTRAFLAPLLGALAPEYASTGSL